MKTKTFLRYQIHCMLFFLPGLVYAQSNNNALAGQSDTADIIKEYQVFFDEYAKEMATWPQDRIDHFNKTFVHTRANFVIPEEEIVPYQPKNNDGVKER